MGEKKRWRCGEIGGDKLVSRRKGKGGANNEEER